jgi:cytochrome c oxidase subunit 2
MHLLANLTHELINTLLNVKIAWADSPATGQLTFQDPATPIMRGIIDFHNHLMLFIVFIVFFVTYLLYKCFSTYSESHQYKADTFTHSTVLEVIWTVIPALILIIVAIPSFALLYSMDEMIDPSLTVKIIGHQWYWSYEYTNFFKNNLNLNFDSFMVPFEDLTVSDTTSRLTEKSRHFRNLEVDKKLNLPIYTQIRLLVSSADVLHSWTIPSFGIKIDACPGRLNQAQLQISRYGTYFGQCSEICGVGHGFMPISVEARSLSAFLGEQKLAELLVLPSPKH